MHTRTEHAFQLKVKALVFSVAVDLFKINYFYFSHISVASFFHLPVNFTNDQL